VLWHVLERCTNAGFSVAQVDIDGDGFGPHAGVLAVSSIDPNADDG